MKRKAVAVAFFSIAVGCLILAGRAVRAEEKAPKAGAKSSNATPAGEITLTMLHVEKTATAPATAERVKVELQIPMGKVEVLGSIISSAAWAHEGKATVVVKADATESYETVVPILEGAVRGRVRALRLESGNTQVAIALPEVTGLVANETYSIEHVTVFAGTEAGQYAIGPRKFKDAKLLGAALATGTKAVGKRPPTVIVRPVPKAVWGDVVQACRAAVDAGRTEVVLARGGSEYDPTSSGTTEVGPDGSTKIKMVTPDDLRPED